MPSHLITSLAKRSDKPVDEVEELWDQVKKSASKKFEKEDGAFWAYVNKTVQFKLGLAHKKMTFKDHQDQKEKDSK